MTPGPRFRGISSPPATSMTNIQKSVRSREKVEAGLSPPLSSRISRRPGNAAPVRLQPRYANEDRRPSVEPTAVQHKFAWLLRPAKTISASARRVCQSVTDWKVWPARAASLPTDAVPPVAY